MRGQKGFSLIELSVTVAIFGIFMLVLAGLEVQLRRLDRSSSLQLLTHPENVSILTRIRRDTLSSRSYPAAFGGNVQTESTLILAGDPGVTVVWSFEQSRAWRREYFGNDLRTSWVANAVPRYQISSFDMPDGAVAVRLRGYDLRGGLAVDEIFTPRPR